MFMTIGPIRKELLGWNYREEVKLMGTMHIPMKLWKICWSYVGSDSLQPAKKTRLDLCM
jgi:hypothetical protein